jgi:hypothetical protein
VLPYLLAAIIIVGLPTLYVAVRYREYRKFLAGAFFVSSGMQFYFYLARIPIPLMWTSAVQSPELSAVRGTIHFVLFLVCISGGSAATGPPHRPTPDQYRRSRQHLYALSLRGS